MKEGLVGDLYEVVIAHSSYVGDNRVHHDDPEQCWCWEET